MTLIQYISVCEYTDGPKEGERFLRLKKGDKSGSDIKISTPDNDIEGMVRMPWERLEVFELPQKMSKADVKAAYKAFHRATEVLDRLDIDQDQVICPHCGRSNDRGAVEHQGCCYYCREDIPLDGGDE